MLFVETNAEHTVLSLFFGGVELLESGQKFGFGHGGVGKVRDVEIGKKLLESLIAQEADDLCFEGFTAVGGKFDGVAEHNLLAFFVIEAKFDFFGAVFDEIEKFGL